MYNVRYCDNITPQDIVVGFNSLGEAEEFITETISDLLLNEFNGVDSRVYSHYIDTGVYEIGGNMDAMMERMWLMDDSEYGWEE